MKRLFIASLALASSLGSVVAKEADAVPANACLYEGKAYSEGARLCLSKGNLIDCDKGRWIARELALKDGSPVCADE